MSQPTPVDGSSHSTTSQTPENPSKKRPLESIAADFIDSEWKLLSGVSLKEEHTLSTIREMNYGVPIGIMSIFKHVWSVFAKIFIEGAFFKMFKKVFDILLPVVNQSLANSKW